MKWRNGSLAQFMLSGLLAVGMLLSAGSLAGAQVTLSPSEDPTPVIYLPIVMGAGAATTTPTSTATPSCTDGAVEQPGRDWDPRLDQRGAVLAPAVVEPGHCYWRLVKGVWYDEQESGARTISTWTR